MLSMKLVEGGLGEENFHGVRGVIKIMEILCFFSHFKISLLPVVTLGWTRL